jgi:polyphosphate kinase
MATLAVPSADDSGPQAAPAGPDPRETEFYLNRELTWLDFNYRILSIAADTATPLLERVKFLAIVSSNLDEFFMKRIGGLKQQLGAGITDLTVDGRTPRRQIDDCTAVIRRMYRQKRRVYLDLIGELAENGIGILAYDDLSDGDRARLRADYVENIFPLVTPLAMDTAHPFPFISNLSLNLLVTLNYPAEPETIMARVKVPVGSGVPRFLGVGEGHCFVPLEEVMAHNLDLLFPGMGVASCELFRVPGPSIAPPPPG